MDGIEQLLKLLDLMQTGLERTSVLLVVAQQQINELNERVTYLEAQRSE